MKNNPFYTSVILAVVLVFSSCKTTKNNAFYRGWHNMNARYNGYYYSNDNIKETVKKIEKANKDDFSQLIPLFVYPDNNSAKTYFPDFEKSIKKSSTVIQRHCITTKQKKEIPNACKWIDENYMLIGQSHFYKRDLFSALEVFEYVSKIYPNPEAKYKAMLWMVRTDNEIGSYSLSEELIDKMRNAKDFPKDEKFQKELAIVSADFFIKREDYPPAARELVKAIKLTKKQPEKARDLYVLAQLFEKTGYKKEACDYFTKVTKLNAPYEMVFNAKMKSAMLFDYKTGDSKNIKRQLAKMLKDFKNADYKDQIYYALAEIAYQENDLPQALNYLTKSIRESTTNKKQKALSYLKRADIYFEKPDYKAAEANYDSTIALLPKDFPDYAIIAEKKNSLTELVKNLNIIAMEDSLQTLAKMSEKDRNAKIDAMIAKMEEEERKKIEEAEAAKFNQQNNLPSGPNPATASNTGAWYFYNPATVSFGVTEFSKKWGSRKLEDNWRRLDKEQVIAAPVVTEEEELDSTATKGAVAGVKKVKNKKDRNYYLKKLPLSADALAKSDVKIIDAYYNAGTIYKEQLLNNKKSVETFEELLQRYATNKYKLSVYYQLYRTFMALNNVPKSDYYKNIILKEYPNSDYAKIIDDPDYAGTIKAKKSEVENFYTQTYDLYLQGNYPQALANCTKAISEYTKNALSPQFEFLKALCIGRTQDINSFEKALIQVVVNFPKDPVKEKAQDIIDAIHRQKNGNTTTTAVADTTKAKPKYNFKEDGDYYWITVIDNGKGNINNFRIKISNVNNDAFGSEELQVESIFLDLSHQLVNVKTFSGKAKALEYYNYLKDDGANFLDLEENSYQSFIISSEDYTIFYRDKNVNEYKEFFSQKIQ